MHKPYRKKPYRVKPKRSIFRSRFFWLSFFILIILGTIFYLVVIASFFQIKEIKISGNQKIPSEQILTIGEEGIKQKSIIFFFDSQSVFFVDLKQIKEKILKKFPRISEVNIKRKLPSSLLINIKERIPVGAWCQESNCFFIDQEGIIFEEVLEEGLANVPLLIKPEIINLDLHLGKNMIEKKYFDKILKINDELKKDSSLKIKEFIVSLDAKKLTIKTLEDWEIFFDLDGDVSSQVFNLKTVLKEKIPPEKRGNLEYVDLRFGNKVYYK